MKRIQGFICGFLAAIVLLVSVPALAETITTTFNVISIKINGEMVVKSGESFILANGNKVPYTIVYNGTTYLPLREMVRLVGKDLVFDGATSTADIVDKAIDGATKNVSEVDKMPGETKPVTRAEFARWLVQSFELTDDGTRYELPDIKENDEYYIDICISMQHKYLGIYTNTLFSPLDKVSRWQYLYVMLFNVFEINLDNYEPASKEVMKDAYKYDEDTLKMIGAALELELLTLYEDGTFRPYDLLIMGLTPNKELQKYLQR